MKTESRQKDKRTKSMKGWRGGGGVQVNKDNVHLESRNGTVQNEKTNIYHLSSYAHIVATPIVK
jgi:transposase